MEPIEVILGYQITCGIGQDQQQENIIHTYTAGELIGIHKCVYIKNNRVYIADHTNQEIEDYPLGLSLNSANAGETVRVLLLGIIFDNSFNFVGENVYLGTNGQLIQIPPNSGFVVIVGKPVNSNTLYVNPKILVEIE